MLRKIIDFLKEDLEKVEEILNRNLHSTIKIIPELSSYILEAGGKRFRPILCLLASRICNAPREAATVASAVIEYIHTATLLHDDVVDEADTRRGRKAANKIWGNQAAILVGDFLFARSFFLMTEHLPPEALNIMSQACVSLAEGEILQLIRAFDIDTSEEDYYQIIYGKTAALIKAACEVAAICGRFPEYRKCFKEYGTEIGFAFQISDDILDVEGDPKKTGKPSGIDFREGKITLPLIFALKECKKEERKRIRNLLLSENFSDGDFEEVKSVIYKYNGVGKAKERVREHTEKAKKALNMIPQCIEKEFLMEIADFLVERSY